MLYCHCANLCALVLNFGRKKIFFKNKVSNFFEKKNSEKHLQLLFTILKTAPESTLRSNIVISLGDLAFRFPNQIEPWLPSFCEKLHDDDSHVRKNTLLVLTHLIANDMIRV